MIQIDEENLIDIEKVGERWRKDKGWPLRILGPRLLEREQGERQVLYKEGGIEEALTYICLLAQIDMPPSTFFLPSS